MKMKPKGVDTHRVGKKPANMRSYNGTFNDGNPALAGHHRKTRGVPKFKDTHRKD